MVTVKDQDKANADYLVKRLEKECTHKSTGYLGVECDGLHVDEYADTLVHHLFDRIMRELNVLSGQPYEYIRDRDEDFEYEYKPFTSERSLNLHKVRLGKFIHKYAPKYLPEESAKSFIKEVGQYVKI